MREMGEWESSNGGKCKEDGKVVIKENVRKMGKK